MRIELTHYLNPSYKSLFKSFAQWIYDISLSCPTAERYCFQTPLRSHSVSTMAKSPTRNSARSLLRKAAKGFAKSILKRSASEIQMSATTTSTTTLSHDRPKPMARDTDPQINRLDTASGPPPSHSFPTLQDLVSPHQPTESATFTAHRSSRSSNFRDSEYIPYEHTQPSTLPDCDPQAPSMFQQSTGSSAYSTSSEKRSMRTTGASFQEDTIKLRSETSVPKGRGKSHREIVSTPGNFRCLPRNPMLRKETPPCRPMNQASQLVEISTPPSESDDIDSHHGIIPIGYQPPPSPNATPSSSGKGPGSQSPPSPKSTSSSMKPAPLRPSVQRPPASKATSSMIRPTPLRPWAPPPPRNTSKAPQLPHIPRVASPLSPWPQHPNHRSPPLPIATSASGSEMEGERIKNRPPLSGYMRTSNSSFTTASGVQMERYWITCCACQTKACYEVRPDEVCKWLMICKACDSDHYVGVCYQTEGNIYGSMARGCKLHWDEEDDGGC
jgi:hypothetical protein